MAKKFPIGRKRKKRPCTLSYEGKKLAREQEFLRDMDRKIKKAIPDPVKRLEYIQTLIADIDMKLAEIE